MLYDRMPRQAVLIDEDANAEEMEVSLSIRDVKLIADVTDADLAKCAAVEPWIRVRQADELQVSFGVTLVPKEDDCA